MRRTRTTALLALLLVGGLAACDDSSVTSPGGLEQTLLDLMVDEDLTEAVIVDVEAALAAVLGAPAPSDAFFSEPDPEAVDGARALLEQAREKFRQARQAWIGGDTELAADLAEDGRELIAQAMLLVFGDEAYAMMLERVDNVIAWLEEEVDGEASELLARIRALRTEAEGLKASDEVAAMERLVLALQIAHRERAHHRRMEMVHHSRHSVFMAHQALELAADVAGDDATPEQQHLLRHMQHLLQDAHLAMDAGRFRLAFVLARQVVNLGFVVVMLEPDAERDRVLLMIEVSDLAIDAAEAAVADLPPGSFLVQLLDHVKLLQTRAIQISDTQPRRAIHILWHVSLTAYAIVDMVPGI
jgi:hypothetical protein